MLDEINVSELEVNGEIYIKKSSIKNNFEGFEDFDTDHIIVIAQRGWIFIGHKDNSVKDKIKLLKASVVRKWDNGLGIGGLTKECNKNDYTLDDVGIVEFAQEGVIAILYVEW